MNSAEEKIEATSDHVWELLGDAFGRINEIQKTLAPVEAPLVKYLLDMAKMEIARQGTGLSFTDLAADGRSMAEWVKALRDEEGGQPERQRLAN